MWRATTARIIEFHYRSLHMFSAASDSFRLPLPEKFRDPILRESRKLLSVSRH
jgi:hypothetical protein